MTDAELHAEAARLARSHTRKAKHEYFEVDATERRESATTLTALSARLKAAVAERDVAMMSDAATTAIIAVVAVSERNAIAERDAARREAAALRDMLQTSQSLLNSMLRAPSIRRGGLEDMREMINDALAKGAPT